MHSGSLDAVNRVLISDVHNRIATVFALPVDAVRTCRQAHALDPHVSGRQPDVPGCLAADASVPHHVLVADAQDVRVCNALSVEAAFGPQVEHRLSVIGDRPLQSVGAGRQPDAADIPIGKFVAAGLRSTHKPHAVDVSVITDGNAADIAVTPRARLAGVDRCPAVGCACNALKPLLENVVNARGLARRPGSTACHADNDHQCGKKLVCHR